MNLVFWALVGAAALFAVWKYGLLSPKKRPVLARPEPVTDLRSLVVQAPSREPVVIRTTGFPPELLDYPSSSLLAAGNYVLRLEVDAKIAARWAQSTVDEREDSLLNQFGPKRVAPGPKGE